MTVQGQPAWQSDGQQQAAAPWQQLQQPQHQQLQLQQPVTNSPLPWQQGLSQQEHPAQTWSAAQPQGDAPPWQLQVGGQAQFPIGGSVHQAGTAPHVGVVRPSASATTQTQAQGASTATTSARGPKVNVRDLDTLARCVRRLR